MDSHGAVVSRSRSEEQLNLPLPTRPASAGGLPRTKSSHSVEDPHHPQCQHHHDRPPAAQDVAQSSKPYKGLVVRETPVSDHGRVLAAPVQAKARQRQSNKASKLGKETRLARIQGSPSIERKFHDDFDMSGSESEGEAQDKEEEEVEDKSGSQKLLDRLGLDTLTRPKKKTPGDVFMAGDDQYMTIKAK